MRVIFHGYVKLPNGNIRKYTYARHPAGLELGRIKTAFLCDWQEVNHAFRSVFNVFMLSMKVNFIVIFNFHWDLLYIVDMSECEKGSFWEVSVPKTSAAAIFHGDLYIFAKYAPVVSNRAFPTTFASHRHCRVRTYVQMKSFNFCSFSENAQVRERYCPTPPHPTPSHPTHPKEHI